jgi:hypothetical protein
MQRLNYTLPLKGLCLTAGVILGLTILPSNALAVTITQWNFNSVPPDGDNNTGTLIPNIGNGTTDLVGGVTGSGFDNANANGGSSDPATRDNSGWETTTYAAQGTENKLRGVQFNVSTLGYENITVEWDQRFSNTSSRNAQFQYSIDGNTFTDFGLLVPATGGNTWLNDRTVNLSTISEVNNNPNFAFRIVSAFDGTTTDYVAANSSPNYSPDGTWRFDMVQVDGTPVPEPLTIIGSLTAIGLGTVIKRKYASAGQLK